jgi:hypothetical protein
LLPIIVKTPKGKKPHGRQSGKVSSCSTAPEVTRLWRGAKGYERVFRMSPTLLRNPEVAKTSEARASQGQRGSGEPNKAASFFGNVL